MTWQCHVCASPCDGRIRCGECGVVIYCSKRHQASHWRQHEQGGECARLALQLQGAPAVLDLPFPFLHLSVIQVEQGRHTMCSFLTSCNLHACGPYAALCGP
ncbi:unnamed protein product [Closterium sp. NIES-53]